MTLKNSINIPQVSVSTALMQLEKLVTNQIERKQSITSIPPVFLWGAPGVGKSQLVKELSKKLEKKTGKKVIVKDIRLLLFNPIDLRGIPISNNDKTAAIWLKPEIFNFNPDENVINILFLDELSAAPTSVQAAAYQITLDRQVGEHKLPDNTYVIAAGNRKEDNSVSNSMPKALANRMLHFDIVNDFASWKHWAIDNNINDKVLGFLQYKEQYLSCGLQNRTDIAFATPRSWEKVSDLINNINEDIDNIKYLISGLIGIGIASEFLNYCKLYKKLPNIENIFQGKDISIPTAPDILYTLISGISTKAKEYMICKKDVSNAILFAEKLPKDFQVILHSNITELAKKFDENILIDENYNKWTENLAENISE